MARVLIREKERSHKRHTERERKGEDEGRD
jgi:hypothetical protein